MKSLGNFMIFIGSLFKNMESPKVYIKQFFKECILIGIDSIFIVVIVSVFIGAVTAVQTAYNLISPFIPRYVIGLIVRDMTILEIAPTFHCHRFCRKSRLKHCRKFGDDENYRTSRCTWK